jgi:hypothetical protein
MHASENNCVKRVIADDDDGAYDSRKNFRYLAANGIQEAAAIKVGKEEFIW